MMDVDLLVVGGGAVGSLVAGLLARNGVSVAVLERRAEVREALRARGIRVEGLSGSFAATVAVPDSPGAVGAARWVAICVKAQDTGSAARTVSELVVRSQATVLSLQNGLGNLEAIQEAVGPGRTLLATLAIGAHLKGPGHVVHAGNGPIRLGAPPGGPASRVGEAAALLRRGGFQVEEVADILRAVWSKVAVNAVVNPLTALLRTRNGSLLDLRDIGPVWNRILREVVEVARAEGVDLDLRETEAEVRSVVEATRANLSSMLQDVMAGRPTESQALGLAIAQRARRHGLEASVCEALGLLVEAAAQARREGLAVEEP